MKTRKSMFIILVVIWLPFFVYALILQGCSTMKAPVKPSVTAPLGLPDPNDTNYWSTNAYNPPPFHPEIIDSNQLWLSISQDATNITLTINHANPAHSYYLCATKIIPTNQWLFVQPFSGTTGFSLTLPKIPTFTNGGDTLYFRTQDISL